MVNSMTINIPTDFLKRTQQNNSKFHLKKNEWRDSILLFTYLFILLILHFDFAFTALLRYISHFIKFTFSKCTDQWFLVHS